LGAIFKQSHLLSMLEKNYRTYCALNNVPVEEGLVIKEKVLQVLSSLEFSDKRSSKMDLDDFFALLDAFHKEHLHFS